MLNAKTRAVLAWTIVVAGFAVILTASGDGFSFSQSSRILRPLLQWLFPGIPQEQMRWVILVIRKGAHLTEYALLSLLVHRAWRLTFAAKQIVMHPVKLAGIAFGFAVAAASLDEFRQTFTSSREGCLRDVLIDTSGAALGMVGLWLFSAWRARKQTAAPVPPRLHRRIRFVVGAGIALVSAAPGLVWLAAYCDGWSGRFFSLSLATLAALGVVGFATVLCVLGSSTMFAPGRRKARWGLALGLLIGGPVWYFAVLNQSPAAAAAQGAAGAARKAVDLRVLADWARRQIRAAPAPRADSSGNIPPVRIVWKDLPEDVRRFFMRKEPSAAVPKRAGGRILYDSEARPTVELLCGQEAILIQEETAQPRASYPGVVRALAPGVYFQLRIRP